MGAAIDETFVPTVPATVTAVELDGERVLCDLDTWRLHKLDRVASVVWACFDGTTDVAHLSADLAAAFGTDPARVTADVLALVRALAAEDLVVGAGPTPPASSGPTVDGPDHP